ncbi:LacI family DNA-binding transcriptional regulator [Anaerospora sp.]|jgi:DNA-binding LacI/PurR family transcriptional regulator|uniref:LacI family DNA-binding transcriptional regulator n=1 Tax=Anaerospora sp. TaxID=1960278 RepID=UPI00289C3046|nr:LacI family DNA-binding transcriptional regulator [Anaerospora sp.]MDF2929839.1 kdgR 4 [Anaerospora sp.]
MPVTINDVAARAGVSKTTVSHYLNGRYDSMSKETRENIAQVVEELGYRPNALARSLKQKKTHTIGAIVANILNPFSTSIIRGVEDYCNQHGFSLILCNADEDPVKEREYLEVLADKQVDGLIINTTGYNNDLIKNLNLHLPVVLIDRKVPEINTDTVTSDSRKGVQLMIDHLIKLGRSEIAFFTMPYHEVSPRTERVLGYRQALASHGIACKPHLLVETVLDEAAVIRAVETVLASPEPPAAIFGANNLMTMAVVKALKKLNISIPRDIAVVGFDDWDWAELIDPPVTVVSQPTYAMGQEAATLLIKRLKSKRNSRKPAVILFDPELVIRKSCGE